MKFRFSNFSKIIIPAFFISIAALYFLALTWFPTGYVGTTRKNGVNLGCVCHGDTASSVVSVTIIGPDSVAAGQTATFFVKTSHGPAVVGGFNVANYRDGGSDTLTLSPVAGDTTTRKQEGELTHTHPKAFNNDTVSWAFRYKASNVIGYDTLYATSNSTNNDTTSSNDNWNWSPNKPVRIYNPIGIINISSVAKDFTLAQNYPNPFNPVTQINFSIAASSDVQIKVYDIRGGLVATLVNNKLQQGVYKVDYNASGLSSGAYFYSLFIDGEKISTKKMLLVK